MATIIQASGISIIAMGTGLVYPPLGVVVLGVGILLFGLAFERSK